MPSRKKRQQRVKATPHAAERWPQRTGRKAKNLDGMLTAALKEQLRVGLKVKNGQAQLDLTADRLGIPVDLVAPLEMPDEYGVWAARTVKPKW